MNEQNLKPNTERTPSERRELARKAGKASGVKRRENASMRECLKVALEFITAETGATQKEQIAVTLIEQAKAGNIQAAKLICDILGENTETGAENKKIEIEFVPSRRPSDDE